MPARSRKARSPPTPPPPLFLWGLRVHLGGAGRASRRRGGWAHRAGFSGFPRQTPGSDCLPPSVASWPNWSAVPIRNPLPGCRSKSKAPGAGAGGHSWPSAPLSRPPPPHAQPAPAHAFDLSRACATPAPACRFKLGEDPPLPPPLLLHAARSPALPRALPPSVLSPVWSGTCLQVKQYLRVLYIQPLL